MTNTECQSLVVINIIFDLSYAAMFTVDKTEHIFIFSNRSNLLNSVVYNKLQLKFHFTFLWSLIVGMDNGTRYIIQMTYFFFIHNLYKNP